MTATALERGAPRGVAPTPFPAQHPWDRNFFLLWIALIWLGIGAGFIPELQKHFATHEKPFPLITHVHGFFFMGWLALATTQVLLIRTRRLAWHRTLGYVMAAWGVAMLALGPAVAWMEQHRDFATPLGDPGFFSVQAIDMLSFGVLGTAGVLLRANSSAHKRLMLLATLCITDAGWGRFAGTYFQDHFGKSFWPNYAGFYLGTGVLIVGLLAYDLITRRRLHPAATAGAAWALAGQLTATWLWIYPPWVAWTTHLFHP
jgi:hypothetical protein